MAKFQSGTTDAQKSLLGLGWHVGQLNSGALGVFRPNYQHPFWYNESLVRVFHLFNHCFYKKLSLYIHIPNTYLGLGFEVGLQRMRDLALVCPQSVLWVKEITRYFILSFFQKVQFCERSQNSKYCLSSDNLSDSVNFV